MLLKIQNPILKYPIFVKTSKIQKDNLKKEKNIFVHTAKCLKAKKSYCVFHTPKNNVLACILALITSLLKSREHWLKFKKKTKILFCLSFSIWGTTLHVIRQIFFSNARTVRFYPIKIRTSLLRRTFLEF
jgi:hypothetical protein